MAKYKLEYIWLDGYEPVANLRGKTQVKEFVSFPKLEQLPMWGFDGSSTRQAEGGSWIRLTYEPGRAPVLAARIQELFGLAATPRIARGRVGVLLHLLAPNGRPQQITDDLASFWSDAYHGIKGELSRRYPRHAWPDDPWNATPQRRPRPRRG
jgi:ATP-dependent helicase HrpB